LKKFLKPLPPQLCVCCSTEKDVFYDEGTGSNYCVPCITEELLHDEQLFEIVEKMGKYGEGEA
jgi:hypothetical protein